MYGEIEKEMWKSIGELNSEDYVKTGLSLEEAKGFQKVVTDVISRTKGVDPRDQWKDLVDECVLKPWHPHPLHQLLYYSIYSNWDASIHGPPLYWFPSLYVHLSPSLKPTLSELLSVCLFLLYVCLDLCQNTQT